MLEDSWRSKAMCSPLPVESAMIHVMSDLPTYFGHLDSLWHWHDWARSLHEHLDTSLVLAQQFKQADMAGDVGKAWNQFVRSGQVWAFLVGLISGYMIRALTTYG